MNLIHVAITSFVPRDCQCGVRSSLPCICNRLFICGRRDTPPLLRFDLHSKLFIPVCCLLLFRECNRSIAWHDITNPASPPFNGTTRTTCRVVLPQVTLIHVHPSTRQCRHRVASGSRDQLKSRARTPPYLATIPRWGPAKSCLRRPFPPHTSTLTTRSETRTKRPTGAPSCARTPRAPGRAATR